MTEERRTSGWGIDLTYEDALGTWHDTPDETIQAIMQAMGADATAIAPSPDDSVIVVREGEQREMLPGGTITLEDGQTLSFAGRLPADLPTGYHQLLMVRKSQRVSLGVPANVGFRRVCIRGAGGFSWTRRAHERVGVLGTSATWPSWRSGRRMS